MRFRLGLSLCWAISSLPKPLSRSRLASRRSFSFVSADSPSAAGTRSTFTTTGLLRLHRHRRRPPSTPLGSPPPPALPARPSSLPPSLARSVRVPHIQLYLSLRSFSERFGVSRCIGSAPGFGVGNGLPNSSADSLNPHLPYQHGGGADGRGGGGGDHAVPAPVRQTYPLPGIVSMLATTTIYCE
jgi:hypothetical protein